MNFDEIIEITECLYVRNNSANLADRFNFSIIIFLLIQESLYFIGRILLMTLIYKVNIIFKRRIEVCRSRLIDSLSCRLVDLIKDRGFRLSACYVVARAFESLVQQKIRIYISPLGYIIN